MSLLAIRNLTHDKVRLAVTLTGIVFAVVLIAVQTGLLLGFMATTSGVIDHAGADLWILAQKVTNFDAPRAFAENKRHQALAVPGVARAENLIVQFTVCRRAGGGTENVEVVGFDLDSGLGGPWNITAGRVADLREADTVLIDELYMAKLGVTHLGQTLEIGDRRARVVGFTQGIRSFTTAPYVFTSFKNALNYARLKEDQTMYVLVQTADGADPVAVKQALAQRIQNVDVCTAREFRYKTQLHWMITTGAGAALLVAALIGIIVGTVVVAQTIYSTTVDHLREFGTLKAMGASNRFVYRVIIEQAVLSAAIGYALGIALSLAISAVSQRLTAVVRLPAGLAAGLFAITLLMCVAAALVSINKVTRIDPALVFKG